MWLRLSLALGSSYLLGSIPTAYLFVKGIKRVDVRRLGSGNVGATNAARVAGGGVGLIVFLLDAGKGWLAARGCSRWWLGAPSATAQLACGLMAVVGHVWPLFLRFKGGKGVATTLGVFLGTMPGVVAIFLVVWVASLVCWRYVSVGSLLAALTIPLA